MSVFADVADDRFSPLKVALLTIRPSVSKDSVNGASAESKLPVTATDAHWGTSVACWSYRLVVKENPWPSSRRDWEESQPVSEGGEERALGKLTCPCTSVQRSTETKNVLERILSAC